jgi:hypothetical protein
VFFTGYSGFPPATKLTAEMLLKVALNTTNPLNGSKRNRLPVFSLVVHYISIPVLAFIDKNILYIPDFGPRAVMIV